MGESVDCEPTTGGIDKPMSVPGTEPGIPHIVHRVIYKSTNQPDWKVWKAEINEKDKGHMFG